MAVRLDRGDDLLDRADRYAELATAKATLVLDTLSHVEQVLGSFEREETRRIDSMKRNRFVVKKRKPPTRCAPVPTPAGIVTVPEHSRLRWELHAHASAAAADEDSMAMELCPVEQATTLQHQRMGVEAALEALGTAIKRINSATKCSRGTLFANREDRFQHVHSGMG
jgi:hypothetical protein